MAFDENILLKIRRQFSGQEKYRLFLQQLDRLESELRAERKKNTELMKTIAKYEQLPDEIQSLQERLLEYNRDNIGRLCVTLKTHNKALKQSKKWGDLYIKTYHELKDLQKSIELITIKNHP